MGAMSSGETDMGERERNLARDPGRARCGWHGRRSDEPMIAVERGDDAKKRVDRVEFALVDRFVGQPQRLGQPGDLEMDIAFGPIEAPLRDRPVDRAPDRGHADARAGGDLLVAIAGHEEVEEGLALTRRFGAARLASRARLRALGEGWGFVRHRFASGASLGTWRQSSKNSDLGKEIVRLFSIRP